MNNCEGMSFLSSAARFPDETVVKAAGNLLQYARGCIDKDETCIFDVLMTSVWATYYHLQSSKFKDIEGKANVKELKKVDIGTQTFCTDDSTRVLLSQTENFEMDASLTSFEHPVKFEVKDVEKQDKNCASEERTSTAEMFSNKILDLKNSSEGINACRLEGKDETEPKPSYENLADADDANKRNEGGEELKLNEQIDEENTEKQHISNDNDEVLIIEKEIVTIVIDDDHILAENSNSPKPVSNESLEIEENRSEINTTEGLLYDMECENVEDTSNPIENDETLNLRIRNVTGGYTIPGEGDSKDIKYPTELPDGMVIELNMDDNNETNDNEIAEMENSNIKVTTHGSSRNTRFARRHQDSSSRSLLKQNSVLKVPIGMSSTEQTDPADAKPVMIMSNMYNSPATTSGKVTGTETRFGPFVSVNTQAQQQQKQVQQQWVFKQNISSEMLQSQLQQQFRLPVLHKHVQQADQQQSHQQQLHSTAYEQQNTQFDRALKQLPPNFIKKLVSDARRRFITNTKLDFPAFDNVVHQILQFYPFFQGRVEELCLLLLQQNFRLYSGFRVWKEQNQSTQETDQWQEGNALNSHNFENVDEDFNDDPNIQVLNEDFRFDPNIQVMQTNDFGTLPNSGQNVMPHSTDRMVAPLMVYGASTNDIMFNNFNVNVPFVNNIFSPADCRSQTGSYFQNLPNFPNIQNTGKCVSTVWGMTGNQSVKSPYKSKKVLSQSAKGKAKTSLGLKGKGKKKKTDVVDIVKMTAKKSKKKSNKVKKEKDPNRISRYSLAKLRNLKQYRTQNVPNSVAKSKVKKTLKTKQEQITEKETGSVQWKVVKLEIRSPKEKRTKLEVHPEDRDRPLLGRSERGAKIKAHQKLSLFTDMLKEDEMEDI